MELWTMLGLDIGMWLNIFGTFAMTVGYFFMLYVIYLNICNNLIERPLMYYKTEVTIVAVTLLILGIGSSYLSSEVKEDITEGVASTYVNTLRKEIAEDNLALSESREYVKRNTMVRRYAYYVTWGENPLTYKKSVDKIYKAYEETYVDVWKEEKADKKELDEEQ